MRVKNKLISVFFFLISIFAVSVLTVCAAETEKGRKLTAITELTNQRIGVQTGTLYEDCLLESNPDVEIIYYTTGTDLILALEQGKIDGFLVEDISYQMYKAEFPWLELLEGNTEETQVGVAISNCNTTLQKQLNEFISNKSADRTLEELNTYWIEGFNDQCRVDKSDLSNVNGKLAVAVESTYVPFSYIGHGELQGYDIDFICRFCREYGYEPEFYTVEYDAIPAGLETGKFDLGMNVIISDERGETVLISEAYNSIGIYVAVAGEKMEEKDFFSSLIDSFYNTFIKEARWKLFLEGTSVTFLVAGMSAVLGILLGFLLYLACKDGNRIANCVNDVVSWIIGDLPSVLLLMILYYMVFVNEASIGGIGVSIVGFAILFGYTVFDLIENSVLSVGKGQIEGARALGYSSNQAFFYVILPQAARIAFPQLKKEIGSLVKETSIVGYISVMDLTKIGDIVRGRTFEAFFPLITTTIIYFFIIRVMVWIVTRIEVFMMDKERRVMKLKKNIYIK